MQLHRLQTFLSILFSQICHHRVIDENSHVIQSPVKRYNLWEGGRGRCLCIDCGARVKSIGSRCWKKKPVSLVEHLTFSGSPRVKRTCPGRLTTRIARKKQKRLLRATCALRKLPPLMAATRNLERRTTNVSQTALDYGGSTTIFLMGVEYSLGKWFDLRPRNLIRDSVISRPSIMHIDFSNRIAYHESDY